MEKLILEVGMPVEKSLIYYHDMLLSHGLKLLFACVTHDIYYTKENLDNLTENQMKNACIRLRHLEGVMGVNKDAETDFEEIKEKGEKLIAEGYRKVFDTIKLDFQYGGIEGMPSRVQLQDIKDVGLLCYYDNANYYHLPMDDQRRELLHELNSYGFNFKETDLGIDKLRTLYYGKPMYSKNQNG